MYFISLMENIKTDKNIQILDIGGTETYWERMKFTERAHVSITLLNLEQVETKRKNFISVKGDGCDLSSYKDKQFDIVFSNSVIEHLFTFANQ